MAGALVLAPAVPTAAQIYKWVDEAGTVHFSDAPPLKPGSTTNAVEVRPKSEPRPAAASRWSSSPDQPAPPESAADPYDDQRPDDEEWTEAAEPVEEVVVEEEVAVEVFDDGGLDPAVRYRANSPRNRPGQPIHQPGPRAPRRR